jgi:hypothetical protein
MIKRNRTKRPTMVYKTLHRKQKRQQHRQPQNKRGAPEDLTVTSILSTLTNVNGSWMNVLSLIWVHIIFAGVITWSCIEKLAESKRDNNTGNHKINGVLRKI